MHPYKINSDTDEKQRDYIEYDIVRQSNKFLRSFFFHFQFPHFF